MRQFKDAWKEQQARMFAADSLYGQRTISTKSAKEITREYKMAADTHAQTAIGAKDIVRELDNLLHNLQALAAGNWRRNGGQ